MATTLSQIKTFSLPADKDDSKHYVHCACTGQLLTNFFTIPRLAKDGETIKSELGPFVDAASAFTYINKQVEAEKIDAAAYKKLRNGISKKIGVQDDKLVAAPFFNPQENHYSELLIKNDIPLWMTTSDFNTPVEELVNARSQKEQTESTSSQKDTPTLFGYSILNAAADEEGQVKFNSGNKGENIEMINALSVNRIFFATYKGKKVIVLGENRLDDKNRNKVSKNLLPTHPYYGVNQRLPLLFKNINKKEEITAELSEFHGNALVLSFGPLVDSGNAANGKIVFEEFKEKAKLKKKRKRSSPPKQKDEAQATELPSTQELSDSPGEEVDEIEESIVAPPPTKKPKTSSSDAPKSSSKKDGGISPKGKGKSSTKEPTGKSKH